MKKQKKSADRVDTAGPHRKRSCKGLSLVVVGCSRGLVSPERLHWPKQKEKEGGLERVDTVKK
ncbi:hypothetical protein Csa_007215, partial [Cucumis sativus]